MLPALKGKDSWVSSLKNPQRRAQTAPTDSPKAEALGLPLLELRRFICRPGFSPAVGNPPKLSITQSHPKGRGFRPNSLVIRKPQNLKPELSLCVYVGNSAV